MKEFEDKLDEIFGDRGDAGPARIGDVKNVARLLANGVNSAICGTADVAANAKQSVAIANDAAAKLAALEAKFDALAKPAPAKSETKAADKAETKEAEQAAAGKKS